MKLSSRIALNVLFSTVVFSAFAGDKWNQVLSYAQPIANNKREIASAAAGALLMYLASNEKVKVYTLKTTSAVSNFTKAKYQAIANYWRNLSKSKKLAAGSVAGASAVAAYIYFDGPGAHIVKNKFNKNTPLSE